jgi:hypothetical protein
MAILLHLAWIAMTVLRFAGVFVVFAGAALFGVYFIVYAERDVTGLTGSSA